MSGFPQEQESRLLNKQTLKNETVHKWLAGVIGFGVIALFMWGIIAYGSVSERCNQWRENGYLAQGDCYAEARAEGKNAGTR